MLKKYMTKLYGIICVFIPFVGTFNANKKIHVKINNLEVQFGTENPSGFDTDESAKHLLIKYNRSIAIKEKFEDKAKSNMMAVTISITLIMGASGVVSGAVKNISNIYLSLIAVSLFIFSVIFMIVAGVMAFQLLMDKNKVYFMIADVDDLEKDITLAKECFEITRLNDETNQIRNNLVFTSFACIRNALICLFLVMILILSPLFLEIILREVANANP
jgi:hypothetical protein